VRESVIELDVLI